MCASCEHWEFVRGTMGFCVWCSNEYHGNHSRPGVSPPPPAQPQMPIRLGGGISDEPNTTSASSEQPQPLPHPLHLMGGSESEDGTSVSSDSVWSPPPSPQLNQMGQRLPFSRSPSIGWQTPSLPDAPLDTSDEEDMRERDEEEGEDEYDEERGFRAICLRRAELRQFGYSP